jgi:hypothetical protein
MGKPTSGPDMQDCCLYMREIERQTGYSLFILLELDGSGDGPRWRVFVSATPPGGLKEGWSEGLGAGFLWPHRDHKTFEGALFSGLAWTDSLIAQARFQKVLDL